MVPGATNALTRTRSNKTGAPASCKARHAAESDVAPYNAADCREGRLDSWKKIASYLKRDVSTAQRWERREGMPVHCHLHDKLGSVFAFRSELGAWWESRGARLTQEAPAETEQLAQALPKVDDASRTHGGPERGKLCRRACRCLQHLTVSVPARAGAAKVDQMA